MAHPVNLVTADLGRHIKNGEFFVENIEVIKTNFYSYTHPGFFATNHHWGAGVLFYLSNKIGEFIGPQLLFIALSLSAFFVFIKTAFKKSSLFWAAVSGIIIMPMLNERTEVRPEVFSYLFSGILFFLLIRFRENKLSFKKLLVASLPMQIIWVNTHIYFVLAPLMVLAFLAESLLKKNWSRAKRYVALILLLFGVSWLNPFGLAGVTAPFTIFDNFGYRLVENQTVWFLDRILPQENLLYFKLIFGLLVLSFVGVFIKKRVNQDWAVLFLGLGFSLMGWLMLRNFTLFGLFAFVFLSWNLSYLFPRFVLRKTAAAILAVFLLLVWTGELAKVYSYRTDFGLGELKNNSAAADFFKDQNLKGPIFNNYDNGGYLIYHLSPDEKVFVDNRPEAYPTSFFQEVYIPMQEDDAVWKEQLQKYDFNVIFFSHRDFTPWGQKFLAARLQDPEWAPVFVDDFSIIFLRRNDQNRELIEQYEVPKSDFGVTRSD